MWCIHNGVTVVLASFSTPLVSGYRMMTSSNGNIFRGTGHLCGGIHRPGEFTAQRPVTRSFDVFFDLRLNKWLSEAGDLRRSRAQYDVTVIGVCKPEARL